MQWTGSEDRRGAAGVGRGRGAARAVPASREAAAPCRRWWPPSGTIAKAQGDTYRTRVNENEWSCALVASQRQGPGALMRRRRQRGSCGAVVGSDVLEGGGHLPFQVLDASAIEGIRGLAGESSSIYSCIQIYKALTPPAPPSVSRRDGRTWASVLCGIL